MCMTAGCTGSGKSKSSGSGSKKTMPNWGSKTTGLRSGSGTRSSYSGGGSSYGTPKVRGTFGRRK